MNPQEDQVRFADPIVDRYVTTDLPLSVIIQAVPEPRNPLVQSLLLLQECLDGRRLAKDAVASAESVPIKGSDSELLLLMLGSWAELSCRIGRPSVAQALVHRAKALVTEECHPEIRASVLAVESILADTTGNKTRREQILREILDLLPSHSPRRRFHVWELALFLAQQGRGVEAQSEMRELAWQGSDRFKMSRLLLAQFVNAVETGRISHALQLRGQIRTGLHNPRDFSRIAFPASEALLELMKPLPPDSAAEDGAPRDAWPVWVKVVALLLSRKPEEALRLARIEAGRIMGSIFASGFESFNLIRAELACGKWEGAVRLLKMRQGRGNGHYLDNLFLARADLLARNPKAAAIRFAEVLKSVERYQARGRLDFELRLACELSHGDLVQLTRTAEKTVAARGRDESMAISPSQTEGAAAQTEASPSPAGEPTGVSLILGRSPAIAAIRDQVVRFANLDAPVWITGETGVGKELVARALHEMSRRRELPLTAINCGSITETLLESELFGHERGAFTGAERANKGLFEATGKGTIFLDEIGEISPRLQVTLLRVLETGEIRAVGSAATRKIACRIVAATNADLDRRTAQGQFRKDLLFRLQRLGIHIPPLRDRPDDIMVLVRQFLDVGRRLGVHAAVSRELREALRAYDWPGNVRELKNVIERMRLMHSDKLVYGVEDLDLKLLSTHTPSSVARTRGTAQPFEAPTAPAAQAAESALGENIRGAGRIPAGQPIPDASVEEFLRSSGTWVRRQERLQKLFTQHQKLTRGEIIRILGISPNTATKHLKSLCDQGTIERVAPSASTRSHYFVLCKTAEPTPLR